LKRILLLGLLVVVLLSATLFTVSAQVTDYPTVITYPGYLRGGPGIEFESYGVLRTGALFRVDGRSFNGNWVRGITERGTVGWLDSGSIDITWSDLTSLIIVTTTDPFLLSAPVRGEVLPAPAIDEVPAAEVPTDDAVTEGEETAAPVVSGGLLPNVDPNYPGGIPNGDRINWMQGDHAVHLYPLLDGEGNRFLHVYRIVGSEGWLIMSITEHDVAPYADALPSEPLLLKREDGPGRYGPALLFLLPDGNLQFNIGPDDEDRVQVLIFSGADATELLDYSVFVIPGG
jgi:hypothetical protein